MCERERESVRVIGEGRGWDGQVGGGARGRDSAGGGKGARGEDDTGEQESRWEKGSKTEVVGGWGRAVRL